MIVTTNIDNAYIGTARVLKMYLGSNLVWPQEEPPTTYDYLCLTASEDSTLTMEQNSSTITVNCEYSFNKSTWTTLDYDEEISIATGKSIYLRGVNSSGWSSGYGDYTTRFVLTGSLAASGTIMSLIDGTGETTEIPGGTFAYLFYQQTSLTSFPKLTATTLTQNCYNGMFNGCSNATGSVELPATDIPAYAYHSTFRDTALTGVIFPSEGINVNGTQSLYYTFYQTDLTDLTIYLTNSALPLQNMFAYICRYCTSLESVHIYSKNGDTIPVNYTNSTASKQVFYLAFANCTNLTYIRADLSDSKYTASSNCFYNWLNSASSSGDIYVPSDSTWKSGVSGIPSGWTKHTT